MSPRVRVTVLRSACSVKPPAWLTASTMRHRDVRDGDDARRVDLADDIDALAAIGGNAHLKLDVLDDTAQLLRQDIPYLARGQPRDLDDARIREVDGAVFGDEAARLFGAAKLAGRNGEFRVIPDDDVDDVSRTESIVLMHQGRGGRVGLYLQFLVFFDDQFRGNRSHPDVGWYFPCGVSTGT